MHNLCDILIILEDHFHHSYPFRSFTATVSNVFIHQGSSWYGLFPKQIFEKVSLIVIFQMKLSSNQAKLNDYSVLMNMYPFMTISKNVIQCSNQSSQKYIKQWLANKYSISFRNMQIPEDRFAYFETSGTPVSVWSVRIFRRKRNGLFSEISWSQFPVKPSLTPFHGLDRKSGSWVIVVKRPSHISVPFQVKRVNRSTGTSAPFFQILHRNIKWWI